jgi:chaperonin GroEL
MRAARLQFNTTETAVVEKPAEEEDHGHGHHHGHAD